MAKIDMDTVKRILQRNEPDVQKVTGIMQELLMELKAEEEEKANKPPSQKKDFAVLLSDPDGSLKGKDLVGWVLQIPMGDSPASAAERVIAAAASFSGTPKGRRATLETIGEACEYVSPRIFKENNIWVKTKTPIQIVAVPNKIPVKKPE